MTETLEKLRYCFKDEIGRKIHMRKLEGNICCCGDVEFCSVNKKLLHNKEPYMRLSEENHSVKIKDTNL